MTDEHKHFKPGEAPFFRIVRVCACTIRASLDYYSKLNPKDTATLNRTRFVLDCLDAVAEKRPLPVLGAPKQ